MFRANDEPGGKLWCGSLDEWLMVAGMIKKKRRRNHKPITANCLLKLLNDALTRLYISVNNFRKDDRKFLD